MPLPQRISPALIAACAAFVVATVALRRPLGHVGEVEIAWALADPPAVLVGADPPTWADASRAPHAGHRAALGPIALDASQVRPIESLIVGPGPAAAAGDTVRLPLAINQYTGGLPDWPSRLVFALGGAREAVAVLHAAYGLLLVAMVWAVARRHGAIVAGGAAALWLAGDWNFAYYRAVLGGTEVWLVAASLLLAHGLWDRRWGGNGAAPWAIALAVGVGLHAKVTFAGVLVGVGLATLLTRWDRGALGAPGPYPARVRLGAAAIVAALLIPLGVAAVHHAVAVPDAPHLRSHDFVSLQVERLASGWVSPSRAPARESAMNVFAFVMQPLAFFERACGAAPVSPVAAGRLFGWIVVLAGTWLAWRDRDTSPPAAWLRWCSLAVPLSAAALFALNRDIHHLAMLTGLVALWAGLCVDRVAALVTPARSGARGLVCAALLVPWLASGLLAADRTSRITGTCRAPHLQWLGQKRLVELLDYGRVERLLVIDYDLYGAIEQLAPDVEVTHGWGAMSAADDRRAALAALLRAAEGGHYLTVRPSAPTIYGMNPSERDLVRAAERVGLTIEPVTALSDPDGEWARLYRVGPAVEGTAHEP